MTSREKLTNALNHQNGPIPVDLGGSSVTGIHCETLQNLRKYLGLEEKLITIEEPYQMLGHIDDDLREALGIDVVPLNNPTTMVGVRLEKFKEWRTPWGQIVLVPGEFNTTISQSGDTYAYPMGDVSVPPSMHMPKSGKFFDATDRQVEYDEDELDYKDNIEEFNIISSDILKILERNANEISKNSYGVLSCFGGAAFGDIAMVPAMGLREPKGIRGIADWYMLLASDPNLVKKIFDYQLEIALESLQLAYKAVGNTPQAVFVCGTDFGTQNGTFCSIDTFRDLYKPYYIKINKWIHENTQWKSFKHSCGAVSDFMPEFIDSGFDIINPVQWSASNMDRQELKNKYGKELTFWGGGINTQQTLPFGSKNDVYQEAMECLKIFGKDGGFIFNAIHNIQANVPVENIVAMFEAVKEYNNG